MLSIVLSADHLLSRPFLVLMSIAAVVVALLLARAGRGGRLAAAALAAVGVLVVLVATLSPDPVSGPGDYGCSTELDAPLDDVPNVVLFFVPLLFAVVATRRPLVVLLGGPALSVAIELAQNLLPVDGRRCDVDDVLANSAGSVAAVVIGSLVLLIDIAWRRVNRHRNDPVVDRHATRRDAREPELHRTW